MPYRAGGERGEARHEAGGGLGTSEKTRKLLLSTGITESMWSRWKERRGFSLVRKEALLNTSKEGGRKILIDEKTTVLSTKERGKSDDVARTAEKYHLFPITPREGLRGGERKRKGLLACFGRGEALDH